MREYYHGLIILLSGIWIMIAAATAATAIITRDDTTGWISASAIIIGLSVSTVAITHTSEEENADHHTENRR